MTEEQILEWLDKNNRGFTQKDFKLFKEFYKEAAKELQEEINNLNGIVFSQGKALDTEYMINASLKEQIEQMKCCRNCRHPKTPIDNTCVDCERFSKWELRR